MPKSSRAKREASRWRARPIVGVAEVAEHVGRSKTWVKKHAQQLGGFKHRNKWCFKIRSVEWHMNRMSS